jgi:hypothetical protein
MPPFSYGVPKGIRTPVAGVKGQCPWPLDDGDPLYIAEFGMWNAEFKLTFFTLRTPNSTLRTKNWWAVLDSNQRLSA